MLAILRRSLTIASRVLKSRRQRRCRTHNAEVTGNSVIELRAVSCYGHRRLKHDCAEPPTSPLTSLIGSISTTSAKRYYTCAGVQSHIEMAAMPRGLPQRLLHRFLALDIFRHGPVRAIRSTTAVRKTGWVGVGFTSHAHEYCHPDPRRNNNLSYPSVRHDRSTIYLGMTIERLTISPWNRHLRT